jgi:DNA adenine methylase
MFALSRLASPLRYPGGKSCLLPTVVGIIESNQLQDRHYVEPYSGGCGLALSLLFEGHVSNLHLNDVDRSVWAFWHSVLNRNDELVRLIETADLTVKEWDRQRAVQRRKQDADALELGFSTFYLNRTNRSGIIHSGGIIGGRGQTGVWDIGCRFNKPDLVERIKRVHRYRGRIYLYNEDAEMFLNREGAEFPETSLLYIDPPYFEKGSTLYRNAYSKTDHERLSEVFSRIKAPWFLTYDNVAAIKELYLEYACVDIDIGYSIQRKRLGSEVMIFSPSLLVPPSLRMDEAA